MFNYVYIQPRGHVLNIHILIDSNI